MPVGSCKLKLGVEKRDADNFASAMALGPKIGPLAEVVGVAFYSLRSHADFRCLLAPTGTANTLRDCGGLCFACSGRPLKADTTYEVVLVWLCRGNRRAFHRTLVFERIPLV